MRFFIFPIENIYVAVAADKVKRFMSTENNNDSVNIDQITIPVHMIFGKLRCIDNMSSHIIVLKQQTNENKNLVMITPPVERDIDVAENEIQSLPGSFTGIYSSFYGIYFSGQKIIFFLDVEKLTALWLENQNIQERCLND